MDKANPEFGYKSITDRACGHKYPVLMLVSDKLDGDKMHGYRIIRKLHCTECHSSRSVELSPVEVPEIWERLIRTRKGEVIHTTPEERQRLRAEHGQEDEEIPGVDEGFTHY